MENMNLLDLNNDILNIIGGYVKKDNKRRIRKENNFYDMFKNMKVSDSSLPNALENIFKTLNLN